MEKPEFLNKIFERTRRDSLQEAKKNPIFQNLDFHFNGSSVTVSGDFFKSLFRSRKANYINKISSFCPNIGTNCVSLSVESLGDFLTVLSSIPQESELQNPSLQEAKKNPIFKNLDFDFNGSSVTVSGDFFKSLFRERKANYINKISSFCLNFGTNWVSLSVESLGDFLTVLSSIPEEGD